MTNRLCYVFTSTSVTEGYNSSRIWQRKAGATWNGCMCKITKECEGERNAESVVNVKKHLELCWFLYEDVE